MTTLTIWNDSEPQTPLLRSSDREVLSAELSQIGVVYEHIAAQDGVSGSQDEVLAAYRELVDRLCAQHGYTLVDVAQLHLDDSSPDDLKATASAARMKFLNEHTHDEEEIRYFVQGGGIFYLHVDGRVLAMHCTEGDLLSVPAMTTHWFDMGTLPDFTAIRFFRSDDGWVGSFTGSDISASFPTFDELTQAAAHA